MNRKKFLKFFMEIIEKKVETIQKMKSPANKAEDMMFKKALSIYELVLDRMIDIYEDER